LRHAAAVLRRRALHAQPADNICPEEALRFAEVFDAAARDLGCLGLVLRSTLLNAVGTIQTDETPATN
jgi:hypothetical protein